MRQFSEYVSLRLIRCVVAMISIMPAAWRENLAWFLSGLVMFFAPKEREKIYKNIHHIYNLPRHSSFARRFARQVFYSQIASGFDSLACAQGCPTEIRNFEAYAAEMKKLSASGQGIIIVTGHLGSWELVGSSTAKAVGCFSALAKPSKVRGVTQYLDELRKSQNIQVIWTGSRAVVRSMTSVLRKGEVLGFVMDQKPESRIGLKVQFFNLPTDFVEGPAMMAEKNRAPVVAAFCLRVGPAQFELHWETLTDPGQEITDMTELTQRIATIMEREIRLYPEHWAWNYKRWRFDS